MRRAGDVDRVIGQHDGAVAAELQSIVHVLEILRIDFADRNTAGLWPHLYHDAGGRRTTVGLPRPLDGRGDRPVRVELSNADYRATLRIDGQVVAQTTPAAPSSSKATTTMTDTATSDTDASGKTTTKHHKVVKHAKKATAPKTDDTAAGNTTGQ